MFGTLAFWQALSALLALGVLILFVLYGRKGSVPEPPQTEAVIDMDAKSVIARAMAFRMDFVLERYAKDQELPMEVAREHERELKRYLALAAASRKVYGMRGPIDELWHTFVIFTSLYAKFCNTVAGRFIHHHPNVSRPGKLDYEKRAEKSLETGYQDFLNDYEATFGEPAPVHLWPRLVSKGEPLAGGCACTDTDGPVILNCSCTDTDGCANEAGEGIQCSPTDSDSTTG